MTWKTYAAVSGATVLAGWLASSPPSNAPAPAASARPQPAAGTAVSAADSDIEEQAARLQARLRPDTVYRQPERNPFRFGSKPASRSAPAGRVAAPPPVETVVPRPQPPLVTLSGIAEDRLGDRIERTAVLSYPAGVLLVHEGDDVLGQYRVAKIDSDAVELIKLSDGTILRLSLKPPTAQ